MSGNTFGVNEARTTPAQRYEAKALAVDAQAAEFTDLPLHTVTHLRKFHRQEYLKLIDQCKPRLTDQATVLTLTEGQGDTTGERHHAQIWRMVTGIVAIIISMFAEHYTGAWGGVSFTAGVFGGVAIYKLGYHWRPIPDYDDIATEDLPPVAEEVDE